MNISNSVGNQKMKLGYLWSLLLAKKILVLKGGATWRLEGIHGEVLGSCEHWGGSMSFSGTSSQGAWVIKWGQEDMVFLMTVVNPFQIKWTVCLNFPVVWQTFGAENLLNIEISSPRGCRAQRLPVQIVAWKLCWVTQSSHEIRGMLLFRTLSSSNRIAPSYITFLTA